ncbi:DNA binding domain-containing protein, excisionase family [Paenibacillus sp. 1_12]|uniref:helix-turn-helix domain-containing protein n=1 Tax=Paenibacillus sp. 1_12 TaxID=1566278 RepID=UPI0008E07AC5|nr:helix-turn-helix domain-containing protein [Paenibacillus sp. 1_12]SFM41982.1 DNA binding domain-containing protein, excisionase family [Paenibacillus sp. 1_12]
MIGYVIRGEEEAKKWYIGHMNSKEAVEYLGISRYSLRKLVKEDKIPYTKSYRDVSFHKTILDAWMRGEFIPGRVALILGDEVIDYEHEDALREHYTRYPHLKAETKEKELASKPIVNLEYRYEVNREGVHLIVGSVDSIFVNQTFLSHSAIDELIMAVQKYRSGKSLL